MPNDRIVGRMEYPLAVATILAKLFVNALLARPYKGCHEGSRWPSVGSGISLASGPRLWSSPCRNRRKILRNERTAIEMSGGLRTRKGAQALRRRFRERLDQRAGR